MYFGSEAGRSANAFANEMEAARVRRVWTKTERGKASPLLSSDCFLRALLWH